MLYLARVVDIHPESHAVDIVIMDDNRRFAGVQVVSGAAGTNFGINDLAVPDAIGYEAQNTGTRDIYAVVAFTACGVPLVIGFLYPQISQMLFEDKERMIYRHASDVYVTIDKRGNMEVSHPSGTYLRIGEGPQHDDLTGRDYDKIWKIERNKDSAPNVHLEVGYGGKINAVVDITPDGDVSINNYGGTSIISVGQVYIESQTSIKLKAPRIDLN